MEWAAFDHTAEYRRPITSLADLLDRIEAIAELRAPEPGPPTNTTRNVANAFGKDFQAADDLGQGVFGERIPAAIMVAVELTTRLGVRDAPDYATAQNLRDAVASARKGQGGERKRIERRNPATKRAQKMLHEGKDVDDVVSATGLSKEAVWKMRSEEGLT
jgi:hypothetical protein